MHRHIRAQGYVATLFFACMACLWSYEIQYCQNSLPVAELLLRANPWGCETSDKRFGKVP